ncbi:MAG: MaoC family dehydratase [Alphaproteobacteria bacterium]|nr:MaoC family dehydratase [Alphaproteobacteria bacterium]
MPKDKLDQSNNKKSMTIDEVKVGMFATTSRLNRDRHVRDFATISGDKNPIHLDDKFAKNSRYKKRIVQGMLSATLFPAMFATRLPGAGCVYASQKTVFKRPVFLGDKVVATVKVKSVIKDKKIVVFDTKCYVGNKVVIDGEAEIFIP